MCEVLINLRPFTHLLLAANNKRRKSGMEPGYIVDVQEDGYGWRPKESKEAWVAAGNDANDWHGRTAIIKIPGLPVSKIRPLTAPQITDDAGVPVFKSDGSPEIYRTRAYALKYGDVPNAVKMALGRDGVYVVDNYQTKLRGFIKRIRDDSQYTGADE